MQFLISLAMASTGAWVFSRLNVPAGALIGAMVGIAALNLAGELVFQLPSGARFWVYAGLGWLLGQTLNRETYRAIISAAIPVLVTVIVLMAVGVILAWALWRFGALDPTTAFLATAPGGLSQLSIMSFDVGAQVGIVVSVHLVRVLAVLLLAPIVVRFLSGNQP